MNTFERVVEIIKVVALVAGGVWAIGSFAMLQSVRTAELENKTRSMELLRKQPNLTIKIEPVEAQISTKNANGLLGIRVILKNEGDQNLEATFNSDSLMVGHIEFEPNGKEVVKSTKTYSHSFLVRNGQGQVLQPVEKRLFRAGQERQLAFWVPLEKPGAYLIQFQSTYSWFPFDNDTNTKENRFPIQALEQEIFFSKGHTTGTLSKS